MAIPLTIYLWTSKGYVLTDPNDRELIQTYAVSMKKHFERWSKLYPVKEDSPDPEINAKVNVRLKEIINRMCCDWSNIRDYLKKIGKESLMIR